MVRTSAAPSDPVVPGAAYAVVLLTAMNLLNYVDRWVPSAVKDLFKRDLGLTDQQTALPLSAFIVVYMLASPVFGSLAERGSRKLLVAAGVAIWSLATAGAAWAEGFYSLLVARALVGVGEAAYATIAPSLIADFFPPDKRNRVFTIFYVATPVGAAVGFSLGGFLGEQWGWRAAFLAVGLPGLIVALLALTMKEPLRGRFDDQKSAPPPWSTALRTLAGHKQYVVTVAGYTAVTFATGGIADWLPTFLSRHRGMAIDQAGFLVGVVTVAGGLGGTVVGGLVADRAKRFTRQPYLAVSGLALIPAVLFTVVALYVASSPAVILGCILVAQFFLWAYNAPVNAIIVNAVDGSMRARAFGLSILCIHLFGDAASPPLIGEVSDRLHNLPLALAMVPVAIGVGALVWIAGWRLLPDHDGKNRAAS
jgi:MFS family permease